MSQTPSSPSLRIGTRASRLARAQTFAVEAALRSRYECPTELVLIRTSGDRIQDRPLAELGGKGLFAKELEDALLAGRIDLAVHSMKDLPTRLPQGLAVIATPAREDPADAFISNIAPRLEELPIGARIGTSSVRRAAQILRMRPDVEIVPLRGNVDTRLARLDADDMDAIVLAVAGLKRLGLQERATLVLSTDSWLPALAQGAIGIEMREDDHRASVIEDALDDPGTAGALACERAFQAALDGSCRTPIAGLANVTANRLAFRGEVLAPDGSDSAATRVDVELGARPLETAAHAGREAGLLLRERARRWLVF
ncbi:MAG TPA: hydroxymethylbilane synthase [Rhizomicrobium sp.]|jgi:hydroxymethylbilane synthase|nr:hydroxymethylbilane synthase [Rhizomicrobium sp.]